MPRKQRLSFFNFLFPFFTKLELDISKKVRKSSLLIDSATKVEHWRSEPCAYVWLHSYMSEKI